jgi:hypothetical protein
MKTKLLPLFFIFGSCSLFAQTQNGNDVTFYTPASFGISLPMSQLAELYPAPAFDPATAKVSDDKRINSFGNPNPNSLPQGDDPVAQKNNGSHAAASFGVNFQGQDAQGWPPDPTGAVGPNNYVQAVNSSYRVYDKSGVPLMNAASLGSLWSNNVNDGDPIVLYDKYADRWFISQFNGNNNALLIAISTTPDPLGTYYTYSFIPASNDFPDYPKFSIWPDGYYLSTNYGTPREVVLDRTKMLVGNPSAGMIVKVLPNTPNMGFFCPLPADADGTLPPYGTPCYMFTYIDDSWPGATQDQIRIFKFTTDWVTPANTTLVLTATLPTVPFDAANFDANWNDVPQQGTSQRLDGMAGVCTFRAQFRQWPTYNSVVICHDVIVSTSPYQVGIRWYELRQDSATGAWSIYQQSTYAPGTECHWLGSIAMDDNGSIGMAYAVSSSSTHVSLRYTGRYATDTLNRMTVAEQTAVTSNSSQTFTNRFGDYSQTTLDTDGVTFWHTNEYFVGGSPTTRIFSFSLPIIPLSVNAELAAQEFSIYQSDNSLHVSGNQLTNNNKLLVDLFAVDGRKISTQTISPTANSFTTTIDVTGLAKGFYFVRIGNDSFQKVVKIIVN